MRWFRLAALHSAIIYGAGAIVVGAMAIQRCAKGQVADAAPGFIIGVVLIAYSVAKFRESKRRC